MNTGVMLKASRDTDVCAMHDMRVRPCAVHQLCQVPSQRVKTISCVCVRQASSQRAMISSVWDKCPHKELWCYQLCGTSTLAKSYDIISCVGQVPSQRAMILSDVWDKYPHKELWYQLCGTSILTKSYDIIICVGQVSSQRAMTLSSVWDKYPHKELWHYQLCGTSNLTKSYDIINCVGQVSSKTSMILPAVWYKYSHKRSMISVSHIQMKLSLRPVSTAQLHTWT